MIKSLKAMSHFFPQNNIFIMVRTDLVGYHGNSRREHGEEGQRKPAVGREWSTQVGMEAAATTGQSTGQWVVSHSALMAGLESPGSLPWEDTHHELSLAILWAGVLDWVKRGD